RMDTRRDTWLVEKSPAAEGAGSRMGLDATNKLEGETDREWGTPITKNTAVVARVDAIWDALGILN
ncbi:3-octaprenyl-4-hydroxybenzoate carboxy-lyase, partial [Vibrio natriegens]